MKRVSLKTAQQELVASLNGVLLSKEQFKSKLAELHPHLKDLPTFDYYSTYYIKDYFKNNFIKEVANTISPKNSELQIVNITTDNINSSDIATYKTNTYFDIIASDFGGVMGGVQYVVSAPAGTGKTTLLTQIGQYLKENNDNFSTLFISGEMSRRDWKVEVYKNPTLSGVDTIFLSDYDTETNDILDILSKALRKANYVIVDSSTSIVEFLVDELDMKPMKAQKWLRKNIISASEENNSIIMVIKHVNKDGTTVGNTKDKHMFTGELVLVAESAFERYCYFEKNRRGGENQFRHLYFKKDKSGKLVFDKNKFDNDSEFNSIINNEENEKNDEKFLDIFLKRVEAI